MQRSEDSFFDAWKRSVTIAGERLFGDGAEGGVARVKSKNDLRPDFARIRNAVGTMSPGEAIFIAAMVSFFNPRFGIHESLGLSRMHSIGEMSARFDNERTALLAELFVTYPGW